MVHHFSLFLEHHSSHAPRFMIKLANVTRNLKVYVTKKKKKKNSYCEFVILLYSLGSFPKVQRFVSEKQN